MPRISANPKLALFALALLMPCAAMQAQRGGGGHGGGGGAPGGNPGGGGFPGGGGGGFPGSGGGFPGSGGGFPGDNRGGFPGSHGGDHGDGNVNAPSRTTINRGNTVPSATTRPAQTTHATVTLGPGGRWWDDKKFSRSVGIDDDQRKRMDSIFSENKGALSESYSTVQREEKALSKLVEAKEPDEARILAQIDTVAQARANLEKSMTKTMFALRRTLTAKQQEQLESKTRELQEQAEQ